MTGSTEYAGSSKSKKYDRQLRLWGDHGQVALENAKVCLINATATGTEILKNLVLPGVGSFTIIDGSFITPEDVGVNFFLTRENIGKPKAEVATALLKELNSDVVGQAVSESLEILLDNSPDFFNNFQLVIATALPERLVVKLSAVLWENDVSLMVCRSYGFIGILRLIVKEHTVVESHPDNALEDLRLDIPFEGLVQFCNSIDINSLPLKQHSHIPWLVVLFKYLQKWKDSHNGELPKNYKEKSELKEMIKNGRLLKECGIHEEEENFDEAVKSVNTALLPTKIPSEVLELFEEESCLNLQYESKPFWILVRALKDFTLSEGEGNLPVRGTIPDMASDTNHYVQLQNVYREQASQDVSHVSGHVLRLLQTLGRDEPLTVKKAANPSPTSSPARPEDCITDEDISLFCKNARYLRLFRTKPLSSDYEGAESVVSQLAQCMDNSDEDEVIYLILMKCADQFYEEFNRYPGAQDENLDDDLSLFKTCVNKVSQELGLPSVIKDDYIHEFCRFGASEVHSVAAFVGGTAAQEAIKLITHQFTPINNTYVYNAIKQTGKTFCL